METLTRWEDTQPKMSKRQITRELEHYHSYFEDCVHGITREMHSSTYERMQKCLILLRGRLGANERRRVMLMMNSIERAYNHLTHSTTFVDYTLL